VCRFILAWGKFDSKEITVAASEMSLGKHTASRAPIRRHPHGWGAIWLDHCSRHRLETHHSTADLGSENIDQLLIPRVETSFMAIHSRYASVPSNVGLDFSHPVKRAGRVTWYIMHNGYLPTIYERLGRQHSTFDSLEYLEYATEPDNSYLYSATLVRKLKTLRAGSTAGNAFFVNKNRAYAFQWLPQGSAYREFYTMYVHRNERRTIVSSERISSLGGRAEWRPLRSGDLLRFELV
jgi:glutamine amidotransferase